MSPMIWAIWYDGIDSDRDLDAIQRQLIPDRRTEKTISPHPNPSPQPSPHFMGRGGNKGLFCCICFLAPLAGRGKVRGRISPIIWAIWYDPSGSGRWPGPAEFRIRQSRGGNKGLFCCICSLAPLAGRGKVRGRMSPMIWAIWYDGIDIDLDGIQRQLIPDRRIEKTISPHPNPSPQPSPHFMGRGGNKALFDCICSLAPLAGRGKVRGRMSPMIWAIWYDPSGSGRWPGPAEFRIRQSRGGNKGLFCCICFFAPLALAMARGGGAATSPPPPGGGTPNKGSPATAAVPGSRPCGTRRGGSPTAARSCRLPAACCRP